MKKKKSSSVEELNKFIDNFYKTYGETQFPKNYQPDGRCHIGNRKNCPYYAIRNNMEICRRGWCAV